MLNKVTLIGNLGADPESRFMPAGGQVVTLSIATTRRWKNNQSGERKEATEWHRVVMFNRLAEVAAEYLHKGSQVYIEGRLQTRKWKAKDDSDRYTTEIVADTMNMLGTRGNNAVAAPIDAQKSPPGKVDNYEDFDDDVQF